MTNDSYGWSDQRWRDTREIGCIVDSVDSLAEILGRLAAAGYTSDFYAHGGQVGCADCEELVDPATLIVDELVRLEGDSDPDEELIVYALSAGPCGRKGTYTIAFGPTVTPDDAAVAAILRDRPHREI